MTFKDYIEKAIKEDIEFDAVIGDVDMPCTFCFTEDMKITDYCMEQYGDLLNSKCEVREDPAGRYTPVAIVDYDDWKKGEDFSYAAAGYIWDNEYEKLFDCE